MSLSLLNTYGSSDESEDEDPTTHPLPSTVGESKSKHPTAVEGKNFFVGTSSDSEGSAGSGNSDDEDGNGSRASCERSKGYMLAMRLRYSTYGLPKLSAVILLDPEPVWLFHLTTRPRNSSASALLPRPFDNSLAAGSDTSSVSVFRNPFLEAERAETVLLERHVKLTETAYTDRLNEERQRAKQKFRKSSLPCRQFKRGRCRLGDKCRFLHAAFPSSAPGGLPTSNSTSTPEVPSAPSAYGGKAVRYTEWGKEEIVEGDDDDDETKEKKPKKRRVGATNSLVPPKRALASYKKQRRAEAPWQQDS